MTINSGPGRYVLFGHPVSHSWSPFIHGLFARQFDHVVDYKVLDTAPAAFRHAVIDFFVQGGGGANITLPHKPAAAEIVNDLSARAERARAVNTIVRRSATELYGENTDGIGLVTDLTRNLGVTLVGRAPAHPRRGRRDARRARPASRAGAARGANREPHARARRGPA